MPLLNHVLKHICPTVSVFFAENPKVNVYEIQFGKELYTFVRAFNEKNSEVYYILGRKLGTGSFGDVFKATELNLESATATKNQVAIKVTDLSEGGVSSSSDIVRSQREAEQEAAYLRLTKMFIAYSEGSRKKTCTLNEFGIEHAWVAQVTEALVGYC